MTEPPELRAPEGDTTLVCVCTDAALDKRECGMVARAATAGIARAVDPTFTPVDGDVAFCLASGRRASRSPSRRCRSAPPRRPSPRPRSATRSARRARHRSRPGLGHVRAIRQVEGVPGSVKTQAVVLRSIRYGEADRILHLYSATRGRIGAIAKGSRRPKSRFGGRLEPFFRLDLVLYEGRGSC